MVIKLSPHGQWTNYCENSSINVQNSNNHSPGWLHTPHQWHLSLRRRSNSQRNFHITERQKPSEYQKTHLSTHRRICQLPKKVRLCRPVTSVTTSAHFDWNHCGGNQEPNGTDPSIPSSTGLMADTEVAGAFAPTAASTTAGHGITHGVIPWSGKHGVQPRPSFNFGNMMVVIVCVQPWNPGKDYPFISIHFHWHYSDIRFSEIVHNVNRSLRSWHRQVPSSEPAERKQMAFPISDNKRCGTSRSPLQWFLHTKMISSTSLVRWVHLRFTVKLKISWKNATIYFVAARSMAVEISVTFSSTHMWDRHFRLSHG